MMFVTVQPLPFPTHFQEPIRTFTQPQRPKQRQMIVKQPKNVQPKEIQAKMKEQERYYEMTSKTLTQGAISEEKDEDSDNWGSNDEGTLFSNECIEKRRKEELSHCIFLQNVAAIPNETNIIQKIKNILSSSSSSDEMKVKEIEKVRKEQKIGEKLFKSLFFESIFTSADNFFQQLRKFSSVLRPFYHSLQSQRYLLGNIEKFVIENQEKLLTRFNDILFGFYEFEILSEEALLEWYDVPTSSFVSLEDLELLLLHSSLFFTWLHQDDDEDEDEGDD